MAKGKWQAWVGPEGTERITNWAAKGCTNEEIARNMGISVSTLYEWIGSHPEVSEAIKTGRGLSATAVENMAFRLAMGQATEEVFVGGERAERRLPPDRTMLIFLLKNRCGYRDVADVKVSDGGKLGEILSQLRG